MNRPARVLMTGDAAGGVWTYALELARALEPHSVRVLLATMGDPPSTAQREAARAIPNLELHVSGYKLEWMERPWADVATAGPWLLALEAKFQPDVVHLNGYVHAALPWASPVLVAGHSCVVSWWRAVKTENPPASWDRYRREVARGLAAAGLLVCPSRAMLDALRDIYGGAVGEGRVIPNGCEPGRFSPGLKGPFVFAAGRLWDEAKNIQALERAAPRLRWPVCIAGEDHHPDGPRASFGRLRFLGRLAARDLARWYARAPIYALPARYEPFGLTVLEAAMAGCALVLGDIPSLRENWRGAAEFVSPNDSDALAAAIDGLIADRDRRARLVRRARARAVRFTSQRMADSYLDAYRYLIARGAGASTCPGQAKRPAPPSRLENVRT